MADYSSSSKASTFRGRIVPPEGFLPVRAGTDAILTRGQALQTLIQSRSASNLNSQVRGYRSEDERIENDLENGPDESDDEGPAMLARRRSNLGIEALFAPQMRSMRLIGNSNPRYRWDQYLKSEDELKQMKKPLAYYERNNNLVAQYLYIDRLLDSSLPHNLLEEYNQPINVPSTISEESGSNTPGTISGSASPYLDGRNCTSVSKVKRTPKALYRVPTEDSPLLGDSALDGAQEASKHVAHVPPDQDVDSNDPVVTLAIAVNFVANALLLILKIVAAVLTSSLSVLASLVDAALDFLSTAIVWITSKLISRSSQDPYGYPAGRRRLEPIGVLVFSIVMITSFVQVAIESFTRLSSGSREVVKLTIPAAAIMGATVVIKLACWFWCRLVRNSSVQALAEDAMTDVVFNTFSIIFPFVGFWVQIWWLDALGGLLLSLYVISNWTRVSASHIRNLSGAAADADKRNVLLYLTMRFAKTIKQIQGMTAYHAGDKLICEVDIVLDESTPLRDSHDLGESLQYMLESVPFVDRAFVHMDYRSDNLPTHMSQQE